MTRRSLVIKLHRMDKAIDEKNISLITKITTEILRSDYKSFNNQVKDNARYILKMLEIENWNRVIFYNENIHIFENICFLD